MTARDKADELIDKFIPCCKGTIPKSILDNSIECAIIAVEEIIETYNTKDLIYPKEYKFWK